jgi:hypothetical protein
MFSQLVNQFFFRWSERQTANKSKKNSRKKFSQQNIVEIQYRANYDNNYT